MTPTGDRLHDEALVRRFQSGAPDAFDEIYRLHRERVERLCRRYLRDPRDVEEAVQDTFLKAAASLPRFNGDFKLGAWLARIAVNTAIDRTRRLKGSPQSVGLDQAAELIDPAPAVDSRLVAQMTAAHDVLKRLPPHYSRALELAAVDQESHKDLGRATGKSPAQIKALLHRARVAFRREWGRIASGAGFLVAGAAVGVWVRVLRSPITSGIGQVQNGTVAISDVASAPMTSLVAESVRV